MGVEYWDEDKEGDKTRNLGLHFFFPENGREVKG